MLARAGEWAGRILGQNAVTSPAVLDLRSGKLNPTPHPLSHTYTTEELDSPAVSALGVRSRKLSNALNGQSWDG
jgi:hypothetical protein